MFGFGMEYEGAAFWLPLIWSALLALAVAMYVVIDGFDLGVGILFTAARKDLVQSGLKSLVVWALSDNEPAMEFYRALGGRAVARSSEKFGAKTLDKVAYAWQG